MHRERVLEYAIQQINNIDNLKKEIKVTFTSELSNDAGGVSREFFCIVMKELLDQNLGLFTVSGND